MLSFEIFINVLHIFTILILNFGNMKIFKY